MNAVFLIIDYVPHQILSIKNLIEKKDANVMAFHLARSIKTIPSDLKRFTSDYYKSMTKNEVYNKIIDFNPDIIITAGWMVPEYNFICKRVKSTTSIPIVAMSDTPWYGTWKQKINTLIAPLHVKKSFTYLWVAGIRQYDYARKLGFKNEQIIFNSLCADIDVFEKINIGQKENNYPKNFLYIGRYTDVKGLLNLIKAWTSIKDKKGWTFTLVGAGKLKNVLIESGSFIVKDYMTQEELLIEMQQSGCFVLPSLFEPWALVIHEAAAAALPIVCTETCGASPHFVINSYNGFKIKDNSADDLKNKLEKIINMSDTELLQMSKNSRKLSYNINPEIQIASLTQIMYDK